MGKLKQVVLAALRSFPNNTLHTDTEIWQRVAEALPQARRSDFARTICEIGEEHGLAGGFFTSGEEIIFGITLRSKVTKMPASALAIIGAKLTEPDIQGG